MVHLASYVYDSAEWVTVNTGNARTVRQSRQSTRKPMRLCDTVTVCQDEWNTASHRPDLRNYGHTGDFDNRVHNLDHPILIILIHEEGGHRISPARPPSQCGEMEERRTSELTRLRNPLMQVEFDIRSHNSVKSPFLSICQSSSLYSPYLTHSATCTMFTTKNQNLPA